MQQLWTLKVKNFGRIKSAEIKIAPMMLFVGHNNTGKSYIASLIWGIMKIGKIFPKKIPSIRRYEECKEMFLSHYNNKKEKMDKKFISSLISLYSYYLREKKDEIIRKIFSTDDLKIDCLSININEEDISDFPFYWFESDEYNNFNGRHFFYNDDIELTEEDIYHFIQESTYSLLFDNFYFPIYLPASRTGFMLSYKTLTANLMETWGIDKKVKSQFPLTIINFLQNLTYAEINEQDPVTKNIVDIAKLLEKEILEGTVEQFDKPTTGFYYQPDIAKKTLPFHITSSLVSELAPLIIFLKAGNFDSFIFEEPESHLHLKAQRFLAKCLVKLVNNGLSVCMTTHSDIFFQQINNLIASSNEKKKLLKKLSYKDAEIIDPQKIKAYQFNLTKEGMTETIPLDLAEEGFIAPTFNETIWGISQETINLETDSEDAE